MLSRSELTLLAVSLITLFLFGVMAFAESIVFCACRCALASAVCSCRYRGVQRQLRG